MKALVAILILLTCYAEAKAQVLRPPPRIPTRNLALIRPSRGVVGLPSTVPRVRQWQPVDTIGPPRDLGRGTAGAASAAEVARICARLDCSSGGVVTREVTRSGRLDGSFGEGVVEHAESKCPTCGSTAGASRTLQMIPPSATNPTLRAAPIVSRLYKPGDPRPSVGVAGAAARDAGRALDDASKPAPPTRNLVEVYDPINPRNVSKKLARKGLDTVCPRTGGKCTRASSMYPDGFRRGTKITVGEQEYDATSARCGVLGCKATAEGVYGVRDGSQAISARRDNKFVELRGTRQEDPTAAEMAREAAVRKRGKK
jgi:hypothetical protein